LYATDLSNSASDGMHYALELARRSSVSLTVVHVVNRMEFMRLSAAAVGYLNAERVRLVEQMGRELKEFVGRETPTDMEVETIAMDGKPYEKILEAATTVGAGMIVINTQSKDILERAFLGSTAERVVRLSQVPVFIVPVIRQKTESRSVPA